MADFDFEGPSFSLGFDFDLHSEPQPTHRPDPLTQQAKRPSTASHLRTVEEEDDDDDDFESPAVRVPDPPRAFKRLRRGPPARLTPEARKTELVDERFDVDEEIESFSSEEDCPGGFVPAKSVSSSSKPSLHGQRILTTQSGSQWKSTKDKEASSASASVNVKNKGSNVLLPKLTLSPLRRFQLIDSDSDDPSVIEEPGKEVPCVILSQEDKQSNFSKHAALSNLGTRASIDKCQNDDLWKDFGFEKSSHIPTPAFDEVIEEYFTNVKNKSKPEIECNDTYNEMRCDEASRPPAHGYFFHKDTRIQKLVHDRLPYFFPLGAGNNQEYQPKNVSVIDYMGQFGQEDTRQTVRRQNSEKSSTKAKKTVKKSKVDSISRDSGNWVNPRNSAGPQKNAGSRRVQAASNSAGHWYTGSDGKRVYVSKNGQQLTGQIAYAHYKKESGIGFKNSKKKAAVKKKPAAKKKSVPKKK